MKKFVIESAEGKFLTAISDRVGVEFGPLEDARQISSEEAANEVAAVISGGCLEVKALDEALNDLMFSFAADLMKIAKLPEDLEPCSLVDGMNKAYLRTIESSNDSEAFWAGDRDGDDAKSFSVYCPDADAYVGPGIVVGDIIFGPADSRKFYTDVKEAGRVATAARKAGHRKARYVPNDAK